MRPRGEGHGRSPGSVRSTRFSLVAAASPCPSLGRTPGLFLHLSSVPLTCRCPAVLLQLYYASRKEKVGALHVWLSSFLTFPI